ncbi:alpha/beta-hydrolase [Penicillium verhagenii]|nr:alpha/beta-hydrolase [Penicillium verhagenii]
MANSNPIFVFVPGAWHTPDTFDIVRNVLTQRGFESKAIPNQSSALQELADQGRHIVVVNHSYGGLVGAGAVEGLGFTQRAQAGLPGGVIQVVWMAAFVAPKGTSAVYEPWHIMPSFFLFCDLDKAVPLQLQEVIAQTLGNPGTYHANGSHSAFLRVPDQVADGLELALEEGLEKIAY